MAIFVERVIGGRQFDCPTSTEEVIVQRIQAAQTGAQTTVTMHLHEQYLALFYLE
jgi:hypothetical protein